MSIVSRLLLAAALIFLGCGAKTEPGPAPTPTPTSTTPTPTPLTKPSVPVGPPKIADFEEPAERVKDNGVDDTIAPGLFDACVAEQLGDVYGKIKSIEKLGVDDGKTPIFHAEMEQKNKRIIIFGDASQTCNLYPVGRALAGSYGDYLGDGQRLRAFLISEVEGECNTNDQCRAAVVIRTKDKTFLRVARTRTGCVSPQARTLGLFDDRDSLSITCNTPMGGEDHMQHAHVLHADDKALNTVLSFRQGYSEGVPQTDEAGNEVNCRTFGSGTVKVLAKGASPSLEVFEPSEGSAGEEKPTGTLATYKWSAARRAFVKSASKPHTSSEAPKQVCSPAKK